MSTVVSPVSRILNGVGGGILAAMMFLTTADVTLRYLFRRPITSSYELTQLMLTILVIFGLAYAGTHKEHVRIDFLISRFSSRVQSFVGSFTSLMGIGVLFLISWQSIRVAGLLKSGGDITDILSIPIYPFAWVVFAGSAIFGLVFLSDFLSDLSKLMERERWGARVTLLFGLLVVALIFVVPILGDKGPLDVSPIMAGILGTIFLILLLFAGMHIGIAMGLMGFLGMAYVSGLKAGLIMMGTSPFSTVSSHGFSVIPLFMLMGVFCFYSGLIKDLYFTMHRWLGQLPGGLAMATVGGCAGFAAVCGSSVATVATMGTVALPEMRRYKYDSRLATGCIAAGGSIGSMIPPSIILIIYAILTEQSIGRLFLAGFIPGVTEAILYLITIYILCKRNPLMGPPGERTSFTQKMASLKGTWGVLALFILVIGGIYMGVFTPTEAAGVGAFGAFLFALGRKMVTRQNFSASLADTAKTTGMCFLMLIGAMIFNYFLAVSRLPFQLADYASGLTVNRYIILGIILLIYLFLGAIMSGLAMIMLTVPIFFPVIIALGFDPIWFGIIIVRMCEIGVITPPVGINVYIMTGVAKDIPMTTIFKGIFPFLIADIVHVVLLVAIPQIALFLPGLMK